MSCETHSEPQRSQPGVGSGGRWERLGRERKTEDRKCITESSSQMLNSRREPPKRAPPTAPRPVGPGGCDPDSGSGWQRDRAQGSRLPWRWVGRAVLASLAPPPKAGSGSCRRVLCASTLTCSLRRPNGVATYEIPRANPLKDPKPSLPPEGQEKAQRRRF